MNRKTLHKYINSIKDGEIVVETGLSCMNGIKGEVYTNTNGVKCIHWEPFDDSGNRMKTSFTEGAKRLSDAAKQGKPSNIFVACVFVLSIVFALAGAYEFVADLPAALASLVVAIFGAFLIFKQ